MVKAASLLYAIFICYIIGIICYSLVLIFSLKLNLDDQFDLRLRMLNHNQSGLEYVKARYGDFLTSEKDFSVVDVNGIETTIKKKVWGRFNICFITSNFKRDTIFQQYLLGNKHVENAPALYLSNNNEPLKISGETIINGDLYISEKGVIRQSISGGNNYFEAKHTGSLFTSKKTLPEIIPIENIYPNEYELYIYGDIKNSKLINSFRNKTKILNVKSPLQNIELKGNIIIKSPDTLVIKDSAILEDIIIEAPAVLFKSGFQGNVQVFASKHIMLDSNSYLKYPSLLNIDSNNDDENSIVCKDNARFNGAIILQGSTLLNMDLKRVKVEEKARIVGDIYCDGVLSLKGSVTGSVYASSLLYKNENTQYDNLLFNAKIGTNDMPEDYFQVPFLKDFKSSTPLILKKI